LALFACGDDSENGAADTVEGDTGGDAGGEDVFETNIVEGTYLIGLATAQVPAVPLMFEATLSGVENGTFDVSAQPIDAAREATGEPLVANDVVIGEGDTFTIEFREVIIPAGANPITGSDLTVTVLLIGEPCATGLCGAAEGMVTDPVELDLEGSTWAGALTDDVTTEELIATCEACDG
jgi:hypothetical protein